MREERLANRSLRLRASLLWLVLLGIVGAAILLAYERHWDGYWQLIPWATLGVLFIALVALAIFPSSVSRKLAHLVAAATIIVSCVGLWQHFDENYETASLDASYEDSWDDMSVFERVWEVVNGSVGHVPIFAAAALIPIALALAMSTIGLDEEEGAGDYVDPRQRR